MAKYKLMICVLTTLCIGICATAQNNPIVKYYDSSWNSTSRDSAFFYTQFVKEDTFYRCTSYWMASKKINCVSTYGDTLFTKPIGLLMRYYENGKVQDSTYSYSNGALKNTYRYYPSGKLWAHYSFDKSSKKEVSEGFDENGKKLAGFTFMKEAGFGDDAAAWPDYIAKHVKGLTPVKNGAPKGNYKVVIRFIVGIDGSILSAEPETNFGYGMEEEALRVIKSSPKWSPAIKLNQPVKAYRRQPVTFAVVEK